MKVISVFWLNIAIIFFFLNKILIRKYHNDFTMNTGYLQIYLLVSWLVRAVFLSELISTSVTLEKDFRKQQFRD